MTALHRAVVRPFVVGLGTALLLLLLLVAVAGPVGVAGKKHQHHSQSGTSAAAPEDPLKFRASVAMDAQHEDPLEFRAGVAMDALRAARLSDMKLQSARLSAGLTWQYGQNNYTMSRPEGERSYLVYVPRSYSPSRAVSLVLSMHGLGDHNEHFSTRTNLTAEAEEWGFVAIFPQGSTGPLGTAWNAGTCCADQQVDDVTFLTSVLALVLDTFNIRKESIHSMGFSNGGFMTERLGCQLSSTFTSIASVSGATILQPGNSGGLAACDALYNSPTSILHIHGDADLVVPWTGDELLGFPSVPDNMAAWRARNKCAGEGVNTFNVSTFSNTLWGGCANANTTVELVKNAGGGHVYLIGQPFDYTQYLLGFWNRVTPGGL